MADLHSKVHDVENYLVETVTPQLDTAPAQEDDTNRSAEPDKAVKLRYALTSAMQASLLACNLAHLIVRPDRDIQVLTINTLSLPHSLPHLSIHTLYHTLEGTL